MVGKDKHRLNITFTKNQVQWLEKLSKKTGASISKLVRFLINKDLTKLVDLVILKRTPTEDLMELIKIAKTPWIDDEEDD